MNFDSYLWSFAGALIGSGITALLAPVVINYSIDRAVNRLLSGPGAGSSLASFLYTYEEIPPTLLIDIARRSETGHPLLKPNEHLRHGHSMNTVYFSPAPLIRLSEITTEQVETSITIGSKSRFPVELSSPLLMGIPRGMARLSDRVIRILLQSAQQSGTILFSGEQALPELQKDTIDAFYVYSWKKDDDRESQERLLTGAALVELNLSAMPGSVLSGTPTWSGLSEGAHAVLTISGNRELHRIVKRIKKTTGDKPVAVRLAGSRTLEQDIDIAVDCGADIIIIEGREAGSLLAPSVISKNFGVPLTHALARTHSCLSRQGLGKKIDIIASGGIWNAGIALKAIGMGARAVILDTALLYALLGHQAVKALPWSNLEALFLDGSQKSSSLSEAEAVDNLNRFYEALRLELALAAASMGRHSLQQVSILDLVTADPDLAELTGIVMPWKQQQ